jgi:tetratricopeptide (TPR) repeat protein
MISCGFKKLILIIVGNVFALVSIAQSIQEAEQYLYANEFESAIEAYSKIISASNTFSELDMGNCFLRRGHCYTNVQKNDLALKDFFEAIKYFEKIKNADRVAAAFNNIGLMYFQKQDYPLAKKYLEIGFKNYSDLKDTANLIKSLNNLALIAYNTNDTIAAIQLHNQAINNYPDKILYPAFANHFLNLADCYLNKNRDSTIYFYGKALENATTNGDSANIASILNNMGDLEKITGNFSKALKYFKQSEQINAVYGDSTAQAVIYHNLADVYDSLKMYDKAYYYATQERAYTENLFSAEKNTISAELSQKYESDKKDATIESQAITNKLKNRNFIIALLGLLVATMLGALSFYNYKRKQRANFLLQQQNNKISTLNKELDDSNQVKTKLFSIISHDLRSPVSSLYAYLQMMQQSKTMPSEISTKTIFNQTEKLLETLEELLTWSKSQLHQFTPDITVVNLLQQTHDAIGLSGNEVTSKRLTIEINIPQSVRIETDANMLTIVIRNILSNAIQNSPADSTIKINYADHNSFHDLIIINTPILTSEHAMKTLSNSLVDSKNHGLGKILIQEFSEKLQSTIHYTVQNDCIVAIFSMPHSFKTTPN